MDQEHLDKVYYPGQLKQHMGEYRVGTGGFHSAKSMMGRFELKGSIKGSKVCRICKQQ